MAKDIPTVSSGRVVSDPKLHAGSHEYGGDDVIDPANIGEFGVAELDSSGNVDISAHAGDDNAHHDKSHSHDGVDGSGTVDHDSLSNVSSDQHHVALEVYDDGDTKQTSNKKLVQHTFAYTNGGNTINLPSFTNASVKPKVVFGIELNGLAYDSRVQVTPVVTSLTHDGAKWVAVVRCNKTYYGTGPPGIYFSECADNDVDITIIVGGE